MQTIYIKLLKQISRPGTGFDSGPQPGEGEIGYAVTV
jgi:hypothetical protein